MTKKRVKRTVKQKAKLTNEIDLEIMEELGERIRHARNYMYSRLAGINSYLKLYDGKAIRNEWVKDEKLVKQFRLPARFWKITLDEVISSLKSLWSNACNKIKEAAKENGNLSPDEKRYIYYVCSAPKIFGLVLTNKTFKRPEKIKKLNIEENRIHNLIRRYARRYRGKIPYSYSKTFQLDADMYCYVQEKEKTYIEISTHIKHNRIRLECMDQNVYHKNIRVTFNENMFTLSHTVESKQRHCWEVENEIAVDKGHKTLLVSSSGKHYGEGLNTLLNTETERLNTVNQKRNPYYAMVRNLEEKGDFVKAKRIKENNLGKRKYNKNKNRYDAKTKSYINCEINRLIKEEVPSKIGIENLVFVSWDDTYPKQVKRKLSRWIKGYIDERLWFKSEINGIEYIYVNPAYTSQECHVCGCLGNRKTQEKFVCSTCGTFHADENAAKVIQKRMNDPEISLYTPYQTVKELLVKRKTLKDVS